MKLKTNKSNKSKLLIIAIAIFATIAIGGGIFALYVKPSLEFGNDDAQKTKLERSDTEKASSEALKKNPEQKLENNQNDTPAVPTDTDSSGKRNVNVLLSYADISKNNTDGSRTVNASGVVTNVVEEGGTCTYVFSKGGSVIKKQSTTLVNPTSTTCSSVSFSANELTSSGVWKVTLLYTSSISEGTSNEQEITK